jgi:Gpi18-like mannosyltransferase
MEVAFEMISATDLVEPFIITNSVVYSFTSSLYITSLTPRVDFCKPKISQALF